MKIAVYGSLKKGFYNHSRFGFGEPLGHSTIRGSMYLCYSYPHLYKPNDSEHVRDHSVEIYEIDDSLYRSIEGMEYGAGYEPVPLSLSDENGIVHDVVVFYSREETNYKSNFLESYTAETVPHALA